MHIQVDFWQSGRYASELPRVALPEVAIAGRSNVGKSSFLNRLANQKKLARTSSTPGRTSQVVLFETVIKQSAKKPRSLVLADLPGYGFSKVSKSEHRILEEIVCNYVEERENLSVLCLLNDIRRVPAEDELGLRSLAFDKGVEVLIIATKCDKLSNNQRAKALAEIAERYSVEPRDVLISGEKIPIIPIWEKILSLI